MKTRLWLAFLLLPIFFLHAQNWQPLLRFEQQHFRSDTAQHFPDRSLRVDSVTAVSGDSIWHLTRNILPLSGGQFAVRNLPGFCMRRLRVGQGGWYQFVDPGNIALHATADSGATWLMDSLQGLQATVERIWADSTYGQPDSLKLIRLTGGDSLILSLHYGIQEWPAAFGMGHFKQVGLQEQGLGEVFPSLGEWFGFGVGDILYYREHYMTYIWGPSYHRANIVMIIDSMLWDSMGLTVYHHGFIQTGYQNGNWLYDPPYPYSSHYKVHKTMDHLSQNGHQTEWDVPDGPMGELNGMMGYIGQALSCVGSFPAYDTWLDPHYGWDGSYLTFSTHHEMSAPYSIYLGSADTVQSFWEGFCFQLRKGAGFSELHGQATEDYCHFWLEAIDTTGDTTDIPTYWYPVAAKEPTEDARLLVYPNPSEGKCLVTVEDAGMLEVSLWDLNGKRLLQLPEVPSPLELDLSALQNGIYLLQVQTEMRRASRRLVIARP